MTKKLSKSSLLLTQEELQKHILGMTLFNDLLARAVLEDKEACEHILPDRYQNTGNQKEQNAVCHQQALLAQHHHGCTR